MKRMKNMKIPVGWAALLSFFMIFMPFMVPALGQDPQQKPPVFRAGIDLRQLDVSVVDRNRRPVTGLTADDFILEEDGKRQKIEAFSFVEVINTPPPAPAWASAAMTDVATNDLESARVFAIVIDDVHGMGDLWANREMKKSVATFVNQLGPDDVAGLIFPGQADFSQNFTRDKARLINAVEWYGSRLETSVGAKGSCAPGRRLPEALVYVSENLSAMRNKRKAVVFFGGHLLVTTGPDKCGIGLLWEQVLRLSAENNIAFYPVDTMGLRLRPRIIGNPYLSLARRTGGRALINSNSFDEGLARIFEENSSYYLLAYQPTNSEEDGRFRRVTVNVNRKDVEVVSTRSYWAPKAPSAKRPAPAPPPPALEALAGVLPMAQIPLRATAAPFKGPGAGAVVTVALGLRQPGFPARAREQVDLLIRTFTPDGIDYGSQQQLVAVTVPASRDEATPSLYEALARIEVAKPGRYELRLSAHSFTTDTRGSIYVDVTVPDFSKEKLSLSGVVVSALPGVPTTPARVVADLTPVPPTTARTFSAGDLVTTFFHVYQGGNGRLAAVTLNTRLLDAAGKAVFEKRETLDAARFGDARATDHQFRLPLSGLTSGQHLLTFEAAIGKAVVKRDVVFEIRQ
jgi:VWFA-related protein